MSGHKSGDPRSSRSSAKRLDSKSKEETLITTEKLTWIDDGFYIPSNSGSLWELAWLFPLFED